MARNLEARHVPARAQRGALVEAQRLVEAADDLGHPGKALAQDPFDPARESGRADGTGAARPLELDLHDPGLDVGAHQHEVAAVCLHSGTHEVHDPLQLLQAVGSLLVVQHGRDLGHPTIVPCSQAVVTQPRSGPPVQVSPTRWGGWPCTTGLTSSPIPSMAIRTVSPAARKRGGSKPAPTPAGVPVAMTVPGSSGKAVVRYSIKIG